MTLHLEEVGAFQLFLSTVIFVTLFPAVIFHGVFVGSGSANLVY